MPHTKIDVIQFSDGNRSRALCVPQGANVRRIVGTLELPRPRALLILNGGTAEMEAELQIRLSQLLQDSVARTAAEQQITLITGGTDAGIFALMGRGLAKWGRTAPCVGVVVTGWVTWPGRATDGLPQWWFDREHVQLEPHHSHFVLVEGKDWGDETMTMYGLAEYLSRDCPALTIFAGGGGITITEMETNVAQGRKMILLAGSGRATDAVLAARAGQPVGDPRLLEIARMGNIVPFDIEREFSLLSDLIHRSLFDERRQ